MRNIRITLSYQGDAYCGWQFQAGQLSVELLLGQALEKVHHQKVPFWAAGRTDSGVHAEGQVVNFSSSLNMPDHCFVEALNAQLPPSIRVLESREVSPSFHARHSASARVYRYRILNQPHANSEIYRHSWYVRQPLPLDQLNRCMRPVLGEHDFTTFAAVGNQSPHNIRRISAASFFAEGYYLTLSITGNAFLWHMVRSLVGTCVDLVRKGQAERMGGLLAARRRELSGPTAPARGLTLMRVVYPVETA